MYPDESSGFNRKQLFEDILLAMHRRVSTRRIELNLSIDPLVASIVIDFDAGGR